jgi:hypothetical protein
MHPLRVAQLAIRLHDISTREEEPPPGETEEERERREEWERGSCRRIIIFPTLVLGAVVAYEIQDPTATDSVAFAMLAAAFIFFLGLAVYLVVRVDRHALDYTSVSTTNDDGGHGSALSQPLLTNGDDTYETSSRTS